jgi:adenine phosphoribosyltransferase/5'/3'-nucleotidase SurE
MTRDTDRPLILVSNDDGVNALGNVALRRALARIAEVYTVAPEYEQSAKSHSISLHVPLRFRTVEPRVHAVDGTPADCVYVALFMESLLPRKPDLVVSGINHGANLGTDVHYSGTVAAAREAALRGIPAIAFSNLHQGNMEAMAEVATQLCERMLASLLGRVSTDTEGNAPLINVNFPDRPEPRGIVAASLGQRHYAEGVDLRAALPARHGHHSARAGRLRGRALGGSLMSQQDQPDQRIALVAGLIREVPDFPKPGILFKDITPLLASAEGFHACTTLMRESVSDLAPDTIVGVEARGFLFGVALATQLSLGFVPVRKPGKLPAETLSVSYELEYGSDSLEIHRDALRPGARVVIVDDLLATGGTAAATAELVRKAGGQVVGFAVVIDLAFLGGAAKLDAPVRAILTYT